MLWQAHGRQFQGGFVVCGPIVMGGRVCAGVSVGESGRPAVGEECPDRIGVAHPEPVEAQTSDERFVARPRDRLADREEPEHVRLLWIVFHLVREVDHFPGTSLVLFFLHIKEEEHHRPEQHSEECCTDCPFLPTPLILFHPVPSFLKKNPSTH